MEVTIKRIITGIDGSEGSARAAAWAASLAKAVDAEIIAVHAIEPVTYPAGYASAFNPVPVDFDQLAKEVRRLAETEYSAPLRDAGARYRVVVADGRAAGVILKVAAEEDADLIVVGSRGHGGFTELLLGSVSHALTHHAHRPVVVVPPPAEVPSAETATEHELVGG